MQDSVIVAACQQHHGAADEFVAQSDISGMDAVAEKVPAVAETFGKFCNDKSAFQLAGTAHVARCQKLRYGNVYIGNALIVDCFGSGGRVTKEKLARISEFIINLEGDDFAGWRFHTHNEFLLGPPDHGMDAVAVQLFRLPQTFQIIGKVGMNILPAPENFYITSFKTHKQLHFFTVI